MNSLNFEKCTSLLSLKYCQRRTFSSQQHTMFPRILIIATNCLSKMTFSLNKLASEESLQSIEIILIVHKKQLNKRNAYSRACGVILA